ncbi:Poly [ADP-ribose] polymerase 2 [Podila epigama]|nr:Poly [ADP-ribose] polymerase 2 [Podila epigama]
MPPKRAPVFKDCSIAISGVYKSHSQNEISALITINGGIVTPSVTKTVTHLITTEKEVEKNGSKVQKAKDMGTVALVSLEWVLDSITKKKRQPEDSYKVSDAASAAVVASTAPSSPATTTVSSSAPDSATSSPRASKTAKRKADEEIDNKVDKKIKELEQKVAKGSSSTIKRPPVSPAMPNGHACQVYVDSEVAWNARLNQTNIGVNNNKFYLIQLIQNRGNYGVFCQWGRVGAVGQIQEFSCCSLDEAKKVFQSKYKDKTKQDWRNRDQFVHVPGKYFLLPPDEADSDDEEENDEKKKAGSSSVKKEEEQPIPESKLHPKVQDLVSLIFNTQMMTRQMKELDYDADKMPLGKLAKSTILHAFGILKEIAEVIESTNPLRLRQLQELSSRFYTAIPHNFGRYAPPVIDNAPMLKKKLEMLESLGEIEIAQKLIKENKSLDKALEVNPLDQKFDSLKLEKLEPLDKESERFKLIEQFVKNTHGTTHNAYDLVIEDVFDLYRQGEKARFEDAGFDKLHNRRLLWHGSRLTNYVEAPVTGYMFDKGAYFADCVSKSANYCFTNSMDNTGLMLLCEVALGDMLELQQADYHAKTHSENAGKHSTKGCGRAFPDEAQDVFIEDKLRVQAGTLTSPPPGDKYYSLQYNEYIVYNTSQIRMRYLLRMRFDYNNKRRKY